MFLDKCHQVREKRLGLRAAESPNYYVATNSPSYDEDFGIIKLNRSLSDSVLDRVHTEESKNS